MGKNKNKVVEINLVNDNASETVKKRRNRKNSANKEKAATVGMKRKSSRKTRPPIDRTKVIKKRIEIANRFFLKSKSKK